MGARIRGVTIMIVAILAALTFSCWFVYLVSKD